MPEPRHQEPHLIDDRVRDLPKKPMLRRITIIRRAMDGGEKCTGKK